MKHSNVLLALYMREIRKSKGWSLREMAEAVGISHTQIDILERGYDPRTGRPANTTMDTLSKIALSTGEPWEHFLACMAGTATVTLKRPMEMWYADEIEDYERATGDAKELLSMKYGQGVISFPSTTLDIEGAKKVLFGDAYPPTPEEWAKVETFISFLISGR